MMLAVLDGAVMGSGMADRSDTARGGFVAPRVLAGFRRLGARSALLKSLITHCAGLVVLTLWPASAMRGRWLSLPDSVLSRLTVRSNRYVQS